MEAADRTDLGMVAVAVEVRVKYLLAHPLSHPEMFTQ